MLRQSSETLAGRIEYVDLSAFNATEVPQDDLTPLWLRGGSPDSFLAATDADILQWRRQFIRTYLEPDVPMFGPRIPAETLERLWMMLAHNQGTLLNAARLASGLSVSGPTVTNYIGLLVDLLLVRRLPPFHANLGKRLIKSPKAYVRDSGLLHALLGIETLDDLLGHPVAGPSWEGWVIENLINACPSGTRASFCRTAAGAEVDLFAHWHSLRPGERVALFSVYEDRVDGDYGYSLRRVMRVTERTIDHDGQVLLVPEITLEDWWTSLWQDEATIINLYADHGTSEQFHSELKTDPDLEHLPSGKFATNAVVPSSDDRSRTVGAIVFHRDQWLTRVHAIRWKPPLSAIQLTDSRPCSPV